MFTFARDNANLQDGCVACFDLDLLGSPVDAGDGMLLRARVVQTAHVWCTNSQAANVEIAVDDRKVLLRLRRCDYYAVAQHASKVRVAWVVARPSPGAVILDATVGHAFVIANCVVRQDSTVHVAEVFSGGFCGWSQAAWRMSEMGVPIRTSWLLDDDTKLVDPESLVNACLQDCTRSGRASFLKVTHAWQLDHLDRVEVLMAREALRAEIDFGLCRSPCAMHRLQVFAPPPDDAEPTLTVSFSILLRVDQVLDALGFDVQCPGIQVAEACFPAIPVQACRTGRPLSCVGAVYQVTQASPKFPHVDLDTRPRPNAKVLVVASPQGLACLMRDSSDVFAQLRAVLQPEHPQLTGAQVFTDVHGRILHRLSDMPTCVCLLPASEPLLPGLPALSGNEVCAALLTNRQAPYHFAIPAGAATAWYARFPTVLLERLGWDSEFGPLPNAAGEQLHLTIRASKRPLLVPLAGMLDYLRCTLFLGQLRMLVQTSTGATVMTELQVNAHTVSVLALPATMPTAAIAQCWENASYCLALGPGVRVFSGPFPLPIDAVLGHISGQALHRAGGGPLVLSVMPEVRGGGAKDANVQLAKTRLATVLLDRGIDLHAAAVAVDKLIGARGAAACLQQVQATDLHQRWEALTAFAAGAGVTLPEGDNRATKAAVRIQRAVQRRKLHNLPTPGAKDFYIAPDIWCGVDGNPVPIIRSISQGASGVILMDAAQARKEDLALLREMKADSLCVLVLGHECPEPDRCAGKVSVSATHATSQEPHLLAACMHNVGTTEVRPKYKQQATVTVEGMTCCSFSMYRDDLADGQDWQTIAKQPVREAQQAFTAPGQDRILVHPWGRSFRADGKASLPQASDSIQFHAKVPDAQLPAVLRKSGFNHVYVLPKSWEDSRPLPEWAIVWLPGGRSEAERLALLVPHQHGLVRGRNRYGLRVPAAEFSATFKQLRPADTVPENIQVRLLFKVGPLPAKASQEELAQWAGKLGWKVKVLKMLGPAHWLVGSASSPPTTLPTFNDCPVLIAAVPSRAAAKPVVQAGRLPDLPASAPATSSQTFAGDASHPTDPWGAYLQQQGRAIRPPQQPTSLKANPGEVQLQAQVSGQDKRIAALELGMARLQSAVETESKHRAHDQQQHQEDMTAVRGELQQLGASLSAQFQHSLESLQAAQRQQESQMQTGLNELKQLILAQSENKRPRTGGAGDAL